MDYPAERICSLLPSATEIVYALGLGDRLVGVTHECDYPQAASHKPQLTRSVIDSAGLSGADIDSAVRASLQDQSTIYRLDRELMARLAPDLVLTQELCAVCAIGPEPVREAVSRLSPQPHIVSLEPTTLDGVLDSIRTIARFTGSERQAEYLVAMARERLQRVRSSAASFRRPSVLTLEWLDPVFVGGHWVPEMVDIAGGCDVLGIAGQPSHQVSWDELVATQPDIVVVMPCGFGVERSLAELQSTDMPPEWDRLPAVHSGRVYVVDGSSYFNRPGPRLIDGVEILLALLHPELNRQVPPHAFVRVTEGATAISSRRNQSPT